MKALLVGGSGFLGTALTRRLLDDARTEKVLIFSRSEHRQAEMAEAFGPDPRLGFILGDVRDPQRIHDALYRIDTVVVASALKRVDRVTHDPMEIFKTNTLGTANVVRACIERGIGRVLVISSDKACVTWGTSVAMSDGPNVPIGMIVGHRLKLPVQTYDGGALQIGAIDNWYATPRAGRRLYRLSYEGGPRHGAKATGVTLTGDHKVLTVDGWRAVEDLSVTDLLITTEPAPNGKQMALLAGTLLGDSHVHTRAGRSSMRMGHCGAQREWLEAKVRGLSGFGDGISSSCHRTTRRDEFFVWDSASSQFWNEMRALFYPGGQRSIPRILVTRLLETAPAVLLAAWYQDDGCLGSSWRTKAGEHRGTARIATHRFPPEDVQWIAAHLGRMGLQASARRLNGRGTQPGAVKEFYWELRFDWKATEALFRLIGPGVMPCLRHKVLDDTPAYDPDFWNLGVAERYTARPLVTPANDSPATVYCLDVAGTHNFISNNIILHNCAPSTIYGTSKAAAEFIAVQTNHFGLPRTRLACARYGNVISSTGSVIPVWRQQAATGLPLTITDPRMSRFWWTVREAVDFVLLCLTVMRGGEILIPKLRAMSISALADLVAPGHHRKTVGPRLGGEKRAEMLFSEDEADRVVEVGNGPAPFFVLEPTYQTWQRPAWKGRPLPAGHAYRSDTAPQLTADEMRAMLAEVEAS